MTRNLSSFLISKVFFANVFFLCFVLNNTKAQCSSCSATTFNVDLSAAIDTTYTIQSVRNGDCCTGTNCVRFNITINPNSNFVNFSVANPAPNGAAYYQINCGPQTSLGTPACVSGMTNVCITYCKPGNDNPTYTLTTAASILGSAGLTLREGCSGVISAIGLQPSSVTWTSVFPGAPGDYNSFLSCVSGCLSTTVTPQAGAPSYIDYMVSGSKVCTGTGSDTIRVYTVSPLAVVLTPVNPAICSAQGVVLTAVPSGGALPYTYLWNTGQTTQSITVNAAGNYTVTVADKSNCTPVSQTVSVSLNPTTTQPVAWSNSPVCTGQTLRISAANYLNVIYNWTGPNGFTTTTQNPVINNVALSDSGTYTVTVTVNGCTSPPGSTNVSVFATPPSPGAANNSPVCQGQTLNLTAGNVTGATYNWTGSNGFLSSNQNPAINNIGLADAGDYYVTATVNGCTSKIDTTKVMVKASPSSPTPTNNGPLCEGQILNLTASTVSGATYSWTGPNGFTSSFQNPSVNNITLANAGQYNVIATLANGCTSSIASSIVMISPVVVTPTITSNSPLCAGEQLFLNTPFIAGISYSWTGPNGFTSTVQNPIINNVSLLNEGTYQLTVTGCTSSSNTTSVILKPIPSTPLAGNNGPLCIGQTLSLTANNIAGANYNWTGPNGFTSTAQNPVIVNSDLTNAGIYNVLATVNGCISSPGSTTITIDPGPSVDAGTNRVVLEGETTTLAPVVSGTNLKYLWTPDLYLNDATLQNPVVTGIDDQLYILKVTDAAGCSNADDVFVKVLKSLKVPNTFTPNNDGINDTWVIKDLADYKECRVQIFNRYGQLVFESNGYTKPWDGTYNGRSSPLGTYYYVIEPGNGVKPYTGYVTILK